MSSLTEEQRRRMEENRLKAIQRREASAIAKQSVLTATTSSAFSQSKGAVSAGNSTNASHGVRLAPVFTQGSSATGPDTSTISVQKANNTAVQLRPSVQPKLITGTCELHTRDRFYVDMMHHDKAVEAFRSIKGSKYEPLAKRWSFPVEQHEALMAAVRPLFPQVTLGRLPAPIIEIAKSLATSKSTGKEIDQGILKKIDSELTRNLFHFQKEGICFGVSRKGRVLIADDMGLGKTIQALGIAHYYRSEWPLLIVAPSSVRYGWKEMILKWLPSVPPGLVVVIDAAAELSHASFAQILIVSYDLVQKKKDDLKGCKVVIFDESHHLKNCKTARAKASVPIIQQAKRAILLSGTPALSRPIELFTQISSINRRLFPKYAEYGIRYCAGKKGRFGWDFSGASHMEELQLVLSETIMIRRMKSEVLTQLPAKRRQMLILDPVLVAASKELQAKAKAFNEDPRGAQKHGKLLEYFSETGKVKLAAVSSYLTELVEDGKKFLCFAHHHYMLDGISSHLENLQCKFIRIDGSTTSEERKKLCDYFQLREDVKVAVLSIQAANAGVTLTSAHLIVFAELFWNPGILTQAEDRAHRIGQEDSVLVQYLVAKGTADDYLWRIVVDKLDVLNKVGLSKDNFQDAESESLTNQQDLNSNSNSTSKTSSICQANQRTITSYLQPLQHENSETQETTSSTVGVFTDILSEEEIAAIMEDEY